MQTARLLNLFGILLTILIAILIAIPLNAASAERKPNFIFVLSDDIAQGDLGVYGQELIQTPRLDQMAREGTRYLQAYCGTSVCAPSRTSFFTGLHTGHAPVRGNYEVPPEGQLPLPHATVAIAEVAKAAGYATSTFGKWGMGFWDTTGAPDKQGVDHFYGYNCQRPVQAARFGDWKAVRNGFDQPIEIYDLNTDSAETKNLAVIRPDLVKQAATILKDAHRLDSNWPLDHRPRAHTQSAKTAWEIKRQRDKDQWVPENAVRLDL